MAKTVTSLFPSETQASSIVRRLEEAGIDHGDICMFSGTGQNRFWNGTSSFDNSTGDTDNDRVTHYLQSNGVPSSDAHAYAEGVRRGHALVAVRCDDDETNTVVRVMDGEEILDLDEQQNTWRSEGWMGRSSGLVGAAGSTTTGMTTGMTDYGSTGSDSGLTGTGRADNRDEVIPVAEEELHVGKREVSGGRVRINTHVIERPVEEQVTLRQEHVEVERRPVDSTMRAGTRGSGDDLFRERTIEMEEHSEEAVVSKEARVVEEVVVNKNVDQRTETVSDTVRKTEVDIEDERGNRISGTGTTDRNR